LPVACALRLLRKVFPSRAGTEFPNVSPWVNRTLIKCAETERGLAQRLNIPVGLSLVGVLER
jgi:hypothetical protein